MNTLDGTGKKKIIFTETYEAYVNDIYRLCFFFYEKSHGCGGYCA